MGWRLGVDVGGTFTDLLLLDEDSGGFWREKTPSTPADSSEAILQGLATVCERAGIEPSAIDTFLHGTTVATNAVLEGKGARVGLIVSRGYRDILQIARSFVPGGLAGWIVWPKPVPLAALEDTVEVGGRLDAQGVEVAPLDDDEVRAALARLGQRGVEAVTVSLMNAYVDGRHEQRVGELAAEVLPGLPVSLSHRVLPEMQEYERTLSTVANAAMRPVVGRYVANLASRLREIGMKGSLSLLRSDGGLVAARRAEEHPVDILMSGPAGGVAGALWVARAAGIDNVLTLDVGGTSTDVALIEHGEPRRARTTEVGHLSVRAPALDVRTVGAGGGSIASVPELTRALRVGPQSAGADPGPAAYGRGGTEPTVTDAMVVLGYLPQALLGGSFRLDADAARRAVDKVATALGIGLLEAARGIVDIANESMFGALRMISVQQGYDPRDFALMGFGGAGPLHVNAVARLMGSWPAIVPMSPGVLCALGDATTRSRAETARSFSRLARDTQSEEIGELLAAMSAETAAELAAGGIDPSLIEHRYEVDLRYAGQAFEVALAVSPQALASDGLDGLVRRFDDEHRRLFTFNMESPHEIVNLRAIALGPAPELPALSLSEGTGDPSAALVGEQPIWIDGAHRPARLYERSRLGAGDRVPGPAIVVEMDATTLVEPGHVARVHRFGHLLIEPE